jgi:hypothetical protein
MNAAMERRVNDGTLVNVRAVGKEIEPGVYELRGYVEDMDYADLETEAWIWSIGRSKSDGKIFAAIDTRFYLNDGFECLWLR